ncbi:MAG: hypothetical protein V1784_01515 [bacterium]
MASWFLWGCEWSPPRDNPMDPGSDKYDVPPVIERLWIEVHCLSLSQYQETCRLMIYADVSDREGISTSDSAWIYLEEEFLGQMMYDPPRKLFVLGVCTDCDTLDSLPTAYEDRVFIVRVQDDFGNRRERSTQITRSICCGPGKYPVAEFPANNDVIDTLQPRFEWRPYSEQFEFTFRVYCQGTNFVWDSSGIPSDCSSIWMGPEDSLAISLYPEPYIWTVTLVDNSGNTATSEQKKFWVGDTSGIAWISSSPPLDKSPTTFQ